MVKNRIMVVEDEMIVAMDIQSRLEKFGYEVVAVISSGELAIDSCMEMAPDLILMDIRLEGELDGVETARRIRKHLDVPVIFLTAYTDEHMLDRVKITEPFGYILKPFKDTELHANVEVALHKHKTEKALRQVSKMEAVATLAGGVAHEFNNALTGIIANLDLLRLKVPDRGMHQGLAGLTQAFGLMVFAWMALTGTAMFLLAGAPGGDAFELVEEVHELGEALIPLYLTLHVGSVVAHSAVGNPIWQRMWKFRDVRRQQKNPIPIADRHDMV